MAAARGVERVAAAARIEAGSRSCWHVVIASDAATKRPDSVLRWFGVARMTDSSLMRLQAEAEQAFLQRASSAASSAIAPRCTMRPLSITRHVSPISLRDAEILLDQQDGGAARFTSARHSISDADDRRREPLGRLVDQEQRRGSTMARAIDSICFCPPDSVPARDSQNLLQRREEAENPVEPRLVERRRRARRAPGFPAPSDRRTPPWSPARSRCRARAMSGVAIAARCARPAKRIVPRGGAPQAHDGAQRRGLAGAVAAEQHRGPRLRAPRSRRRAGCDSARYGCGRRKA